MNNCPCCSNLLLKHWKQGKTYWYCGTCRQEMPNLNLVSLVSSYQKEELRILNKLSNSPQKLSSVPDYSLSNEQ